MSDPDERAGGAEIAGSVVPSVPQSVARIRRYAVDVCRAHGCGARSDTLALLVSEVATNALLHGTGDVHVRVTTDSSRIRVEVGDGSSAVPAPRSASARAEGGRGTALVEALAAQWGVVPDPSGKIVWFELSTA